MFAKDVGMAYVCQGCRNGLCLPRTIHVEQNVFTVKSGVSANISQSCPT